MAPDDEKLLIRQAQNGNTSAFERLVQRYDKRVLSIAANYVRSSEDAKDIYQEVLIKVYRGLPRFQGLSEFSTWLYRITTNVCLTHKAQKKNKYHASIDEERDGEDGESYSLKHSLADTGTTDQRMLDGEISSSIDNALGSLSPQQKMVFTLRHYEGYKLREIAVMMECTEGTVKKYLFTATRKMREELKDLV
ncbi:MAG TPA: sigma-70 family RNA polymerase sigma factor [Bacteroidota bacterium]|nr:sigma-70 family RNA polymerase sigma factor [Bacteroidota bacterium]